MFCFLCSKWKLRSIVQSSAEYPMPTKFHLKNLKKEAMNSTDILDYLIEVSVVHVALVQHKYSVFLWKHNLSWK